MIPACMQSRPPHTTPCSSGRVVPSERGGLPLLWGRLRRSLPSATPCPCLPRTLGQSVRVRALVVSSSSAAWSNPNNATQSERRRRPSPDAPALNNACHPPRAPLSFRPTPPPSPGGAQPRGLPGAQGRRDAGKGCPLLHPFFEGGEGQIRTRSPKSAGRAPPSAEGRAADSLGLERGGGPLAPNPSPA